MANSVEILKWSNMISAIMLITAGIMQIISLMFLLQSFSFDFFMCLFLPFFLVALQSLRSAPIRQRAEAGVRGEELQVHDHLPGTWNVQHLFGLSRRLSTGGLHQRDHRLRHRRYALRHWCLLRDYALLRQQTRVERIQRVVGVSALYKFLNSKLPRMNSKIIQRLTPTKFALRDENVNTLNTKKTPKKMNCMNHPGKRAKYSLPKDPSVSLCSRCAVSMVGKGFKVEELQGYEEDFRKDKITKFLQQVNQQMPQIDKILTAVMAKRDDIQKYYEQQREKVTRFYTSLRDQLDTEKERIVTQLNLNYKQISKHYDDAILQLYESRSENQSMQKDIEQNINRIIKQIQLEPFNNIMNSYMKNLLSVSQKLEEIARTPIDVLKLVDSLQVKDFFTVGTLKTSLIKKSLQEMSQRNATNESVYVSFENKEQFTQPRQPKMALPLPKTPKQPIVPVKNIDLFEIQPTEVEEFEEGHSQMIEREDIENSYQMLMYDSQSDNDDSQDITQSILEQAKPPVKMFASPQFKDH